MKKLLISLALILIVAAPALAFPPMPSNTGDMTKTTYDADANGKADATDQIGTLTNGMVCESDGTQVICATDPASLGISGSTGATDNAVLRADGVGGSTLQSSRLAVDDSGTATTDNFSATETLSAERVTNGTFDTDLTGWTGTNWAQSGGTALHTAGSTAALTQAGTTGTASQLEKVSVTVSGRTAGGITVAIGSTTSYSLWGNGTLTVYIYEIGTGALTITPTSTFDGAVDDVSVKTVTNAALTGATATLNGPVSASRFFAGTQDSSILLNLGTPVLSVKGYETTGIGISQDTVAMTVNGSARMQCTSAQCSFSQALTGTTGTFSGAMRFSSTSTPASAAAACTTGDWTWDASYMYICTATNTWKRAAIATW